MAFTSYGYDGSVSEPSWVTMQRFLGMPYGVDGPTDLGCTIKTGVDRTVTIAAGTAGGQGITDISDAAVDVEIPSVATGTRFDMIVLHRNWDTNTTTVARIEGGTQEITLPSRDTTPGTVDDQPLALVGVTAGSTDITVVRDLRAWPGIGALYAVNTLALQYLAKIGMQVRIGNKLYLYRLNTLGTAGEWYWTSLQKVYGQAATPAYEDGALWIKTAT